jgi:hypothetical protein
MPYTHLTSPYTSLRTRSFVNSEPSGNGSSNYGPGILLHSSCKALYGIRAEAQQAHKAADHSIVAKSQLKQELAKEIFVATRPSKPLPNVSQTAANIAPLYPSHSSSHMASRLMPMICTILMPGASTPLSITQPLCMKMSR